MDHETEEAPQDPGRDRRQTSTMAKAAQYAKKSGGGSPEGPARSGRRVDGVRERAGDYGPPQEPSQEEKAGRLDSTRLFDTAQGALSYPQLSERLAVALTGIFDRITQAPPDQIAITPEWICQCHRDLAGSLFPDWAGRYRDVNVQVGPHTPPPFYELPGLVRLFCDDLSERLRHVNAPESGTAKIAELLAWIDWRFQWIHPFRDFNGRIGRVLLAAAMYKLALPHVQTAPLDEKAHREYLNALRVADSGDLRSLAALWVHRLGEEL